MDSVGPLADRGCWGGCPELGVVVVVVVVEERGTTVAPELALPLPEEEVAGPPVDGGWGDLGIKEVAIRIDAGLPLPPDEELEDCIMENLVGVGGTVEPPPPPPASLL